MIKKSNKLLKRVACLGALVGTAFSSSTASAYVYCGFLDHQFIFNAYYFHSQFWVDMVIAESQKWNRIYPALRIDRFESNSVPGGRDGINIIAWISEADFNATYNSTWTKGDVGLTVTWYDRACNRVIEQDMLFNPAISNFTPQTKVPYQLGFQEIALHELGHAVTLDHEDRSLSVMTAAGSVSNVLHHNDKVGWNRSAGQKFNPLPARINDMGIFPLQNTPGAKIYSTLSSKFVIHGTHLTIRNLTVENLSPIFPFANAQYRFVLESQSTGKVFEMGTLTWASFNRFSDWSGNLTFIVPPRTPTGKYRVAAIFNGKDDDSSNDRADFGTITVF